MDPTLEKARELIETTEAANNAVLPEIHNRGGLIYDLYYMRREFDGMVDEIYHPIVDMYYKTRLKEKQMKHDFAINFKRPPEYIREYHQQVDDNFKRDVELFLKLNYNIWNDPENYAMKWRRINKENNEVITSKNWW